MRRALTVLALVVVAACDASVPGYTWADYRLEVGSADAAMRLALLEARAETVAACRVVGVGVGTCGGPRRYLAYSLTGSIEVEVLEVAGRYADADRRALAELDAGFGCGPSTPPPPALAGGRCALPFDWPPGGDVGAGSAADRR